MGTTPSRGAADCVDGFAGEYPCKNIDLGAFVSHADLGSTIRRGSDIWGWTDSHGNEFAIACCADGTSFVDVTLPDEPVVLGFLPTQTDPSNWRDVKVFEGRAYIGSEALDHGLQVFDMHQLTDAAESYRRRKNSPRDIAAEGHFKLGTVFNNTAFYHEFGSSHNIVINEASGFLYAVGTKTCAGGLHILDIRTPDDPQFVGCYSDDGYTHDSECVNYHGPDAQYHDHEICFNYNEDTLTIVDVTDKDNMKMLSRTGYEGAKYTHQGWLNDAQTRLVMDDEKDEMDYAPLQGHTRTIVWDVESLAAPFIIGNVDSAETAIDHNQYVHNDFIWQSNYCAGLRVLDEAGMNPELMIERAYFDVAPDCDTAVFSGAWSVYPFFKSGTQIVQSIERGLFVMKPNLDAMKK
jgi:choice-of-anchor B domain-containing protein